MQSATSPSETRYSEACSSEACSSEACSSEACSCEECSPGTRAHGAGAFKIAGLRAVLAALFGLWWLAVAFQAQAQTLVVDPPTLPGGTQGRFYSVALQASGGVAPYTFSLASGQLPPGLRLDSDAVLRGTPSQAGTYTFGIATRDSATPAATGARNYTLTVATYDLAFATPSMLPLGAVGQPYSVQFAATGGLAPYTYRYPGIGAGTLPTGLSLDAGGLLSGTLLAYPSFNFAIEVTDAFGVTVRAVFTLPATVPTLNVQPTVLLPARVGQSYTQAFSVSGGVAPYRFLSVGNGCTPTSTPSSGCGNIVSISPNFGTRLPPGMQFDPSGVLQGIPTMAGTYQFTLAVSDSTWLGHEGAYIGVPPPPGGYHTYTLRIDPPLLRVDTTALQAGTVGSAYAQTLQASGGVPPYSFALNAGALPPGLALSAAGVISGTPTAVGDYDVTVQVQDAGGQTATQALRLSVGTPPVTAQSRTIDLLAGVVARIDLTEGATGGPYTAASVVSLEPAGAGSFEVLRVGEGAAARFTLVFTPAPTFSGVVTVRYTLSAGTATSLPATLTLNVAARPDPTRDPEVEALGSAGVQAARRFAQTQVGNVQERMRSLHRARGAGAADARLLDSRLFLSLGADCAPGAAGALDAGCSGTPGGLALSGASADGADESGRTDSRWGLWMAGTVRSGGRDGDRGTAAFDFETDGISLGADYRLSPALTLGLGAGYGSDDTRVGGRGSRSDARAYGLLLYGSYSPAGRVFVDALWGHQRLDFDLRRHVSANGAWVRGTRRGAQWFGSVSVGADLEWGGMQSGGMQSGGTQSGAWRFTPYARLDQVHGRLDGYVETGDPVFALAYDAMDLDSTTGNAGLRVDWRREVAWGVFAPQFGLEYQHDFDGIGSQGIRYADLPGGPFHRTALRDLDRSRWLLSLGASLDLQRWHLRIDYRSLVGSEGERDEGVQLSIGAEY